MWAPTRFRSQSPFPRSAARLQLFCHRRHRPFEAGRHASNRRGSGWRPSRADCRAAYPERLSRPRGVDAAADRRCSTTWSAACVTPLLMLFGAVGVVLLIACANIAEAAAGARGVVAAARAGGAARAGLVARAAGAAPVDRKPAAGCARRRRRRAWSTGVAAGAAARDSCPSGSAAAVGSPRSAAGRWRSPPGARSLTALLFGTAAGGAVLERRRQHGAEGRIARRRPAHAAGCARRWSSSSSRWRSCCSSAPRCSCAASGASSRWTPDSIGRNVLTAKLWLPQPNDPKPGPVFASHHRPSGPLHGV